MAGGKSGAVRRAWARRAPWRVEMAGRLCGALGRRAPWRVEMAERQTFEPLNQAAQRPIERAPSGAIERVPPCGTMKPGGFAADIMTIVHIAAGLEFGGVAEVAVMLALHQRLAGHAVRLVTVARPEDELIAGVKRAAAAGVEIVRFAPSFPRPLFFSWRMMAGLAAVIKDADMVHVHSNWTFPVWWGCRTALKYGKRLIMTPHGCLSPERLAHSRWKKRLAGALDRRFLRRADVLHATCEEEARDIAGYCGGYCDGYCDDGVVAMASVKAGRLCGALGRRAPWRSGGLGAGKACEMAGGKEGAELLPSSSKPQCGCEKGGPAVVVVPNGVDLDEFNPDVKKGYWRERYPELDGRRVVLALGRLHPVKGLDLLLEAWELLLRRRCRRNDEGKRGGGTAVQCAGAVQSERRDGWQSAGGAAGGNGGAAVLVIAGPDEQGTLAQLRRQVSEAGLEQCVYFAGAVPSAERAEAIASAQFLVLPSRHENFGLTVVEALACGVPVIVTKGAPWAECAARCGWWVEVNAGALAEALGEALELSEEERLELGANGRRLVARRYDWAALAERVVIATVIATTVSSQ